MKLKVPLSTNIWGLSARKPRLSFSRAKANMSHCGLQQATAIHWREPTLSLWWKPALKRSTWWKPPLKRSRLTHSIPTCPLRNAFPSFSAWAPWLQCSGSACHQTWIVLNLSTSAQLTKTIGAKLGSLSGVYIQAGQEDNFRTSLCLQWASTVIPTQDNWILQATKGKAKPKLMGC